MKRLTLALALVVLLAGTAWAQPRATVKFGWTQPDTTAGGTHTEDGWLKEYRIFVATPSDTVFYGVVAAPAAVADTAFASINLQIGLPSAVSVEAVDIWDQIGPRSVWSDVHIVIPEPPGRAGKPGAVE